MSRIVSIKFCLWTHLQGGHLFVLLPLCYFNRWQVCHRGDQEIHQDILTVRGAIHQRTQRGGQVVREQVMVVPVRPKDINT